MIPGRSKIHTTRSAAQLLGVSVPTVQQLVESGHIPAWKTKGGHRRIPDAALQAYLSRQSVRAASPEASAPSSAPPSESASISEPVSFREPAAIAAMASLPGPTAFSELAPSSGAMPLFDSGSAPPSEAAFASLKMVILAGDRSVQFKYQGKLQAWGLPIQTLTAFNSHDALVDVVLHRPQVVLVDLEMPEGELGQLVACITRKPELSGTRIAVCSIQKPALFEGDCPDTVCYVRKSLSQRGLRDYLRGCCAVWREPLRQPAAPARVESA